jgi:hypothetical protein
MLSTILLHSCGWGSSSPDQVIRFFVSAADRGDFATVESYFTKRLHDFLSPGQIQGLWARQSPTQVLDVSTVGNTATVDLEILLNPDRIANSYGIPVEQLLDWIENPPSPRDPNLGEIAELVRPYQRQGDQIRTVSRFTLYRKGSQWQIETFQAQPINTGANASPAELGDPEPFELTGRVRNVGGDTLGVFIDSSSDNLEPYQEGWISLRPDTDLDLRQDDVPIEWSDLRAGQQVEIIGTVRIALEERQGRRPASFRASQILVVQ